ncbi:MAG: fructosamine kinase family protein [Gammaproteobacteria bacterium]|nr:fructosamine kinase family protein [Gammaproteobacteria bacterium]
MLSPAVCSSLAAAGIRIRPASTRTITGGSINECYRIEAADGQSLFLKLNGADCAAMFAAECAGLRELEAARAVRVPAPLAHGQAGDQVWLAMEWLDLEPGTTEAAARLGERLAIQHRRFARRYGWQRDNTIGVTPQPNGWADDWVAFWRERRLAPQLRRAVAAGHGVALAGRGERVLDALPRLLAGHRPEPSLLHGDLWGGNWAMTGAAEPVIFDPAVYYGDRECDLAMTELFGGFPRQFYAAYEAAWPLPPRYRLRRDVYNLYHVLNHLNLFGGGYLGQAVALMTGLLAAVPGRG